MKKLYQITYDDSFKRNELTSFLESVSGCDNWMYSIPHSVFVFSCGSALDLFNAIDRRFAGHGRFFVTEVPRRNSEGWIPESHWKIMNDNRVVHEYALAFDGYWMAGSENDLPQVPGVYCVYAALPNESARNVTLRRILYVGKAGDVRARHVNHEEKPYWTSRLQDGECLCYSVAKMAMHGQEVCEAALIYKLQPVCNTRGKESFSHGATRISTSGANALIPLEIVVGA